MSEGRISDEVQIALSELGILTFRNNVGKAKIRDRWVAFGVGGAGGSDLIAVVDGRACFIEIKTPAGRQSGAQKQFQQIVEHYKGVYVVLRSVEDARAWAREMRTSARSTKRMVKERIVFAHPDKWPQAQDLAHGIAARLNVLRGNR